MTIGIQATDRDGVTRTIKGEPGDLLMRLLRDQNFGIEGTCGGVSSCGSCHIYAGNDLQRLLENAGDDEREMLDALAEVVEVRPESRLSCQIALSGDMDGASLTIAPQI